ncbi:MAG: (d)CMP kinase [Blastocatellales bacterium]|nr:(d)CMP kinase [Blastocatellales bacterium]
MSNREPIIAIDGPAGAGKSTLARELARRLGFLYINTGAMYRAVAWKALRDGIDLQDTDRLGALAAQSIIDLRGGVDDMRVLIDGRDITEEIVTPGVSRAASIVSTVSGVRRALVARQQEMGRAGGVVMEGRDIGTKVFPEAEVKIFLDASNAARSERRYLEDLSRGKTAPSLETTQAEIEERDRRDSSRSDSPLVQAADAVRIDSSVLTVEQVIKQAMALIAARRSENAEYAE